MPDPILKEANRKKLDGIISQMVANRESDADIQLLVDDFKLKYGEKKNLNGNGLPIGGVDLSSGLNPFQQASEKHVPQPYIKPRVKPKNIAEGAADDGNYLGAFWNQIVNSGTDFVGGMVRLIAKSNPYAPALIASADILGDKAESLVKKARSGSSSEKYEQGIQAGFDLSNGISMDDAKALPLLLSRFAADAGLSIPTAGASFVAQGYNQGLKEYDTATQGKDSNSNTRELFGMVYGTINGLADKIGLDFITKNPAVAKTVKKAILRETVQELAKVSGKITTAVIEQVATKVAKKGFSKLKSVGVKGLASGGFEGTTESIQGALSDGLKLLTNKLSDEEVFNKQEVTENFLKNRLNDFAGGAVLGGVAGSAIRGIQSTNDIIANRVAEATSPQELESIKAQMLSEIAEQGDRIDGDRANALVQAIEKYAQATEKLPATLSATQRKKALNNIIERDRVNEAIKQRTEESAGADEALAPQAQQDLEILEAKKQTLNDNIVEATTDEKFKYFKDSEKDKWYKQLGEDGQPEEITKQQYDLEKQSAPKEDTRVLNQQTGKWEAPAEVTETVEAESVPLAEVDSEEVQSIPVEEVISSEQLELDRREELANQKEFWGDHPALPDMLQEINDRYDAAQESIASKEALAEAQPDITEFEQAPIVEDAALTDEADATEPVAVEAVTSLKPGDRVSFTNQLKEADTGEIVEIKPGGDYVVLKSNGVRNNIAGDKLSKVEEKVTAPVVTENNSVDLTKIKKDAADIQNGKSRLDRLSPTEEQGRREGGSRNVEASLIAGASKGADSSPQSAARQVEALTDYAKKEGIWVDNVSEKYGEDVERGAEATVHDNKDGTITKVITPYFSEDPIDFLDSRISLHNAIFPDTPYTLEGFGNNEKGEFSFIVKQPFIDGEKPTTAEIQEDLAKLGFKHQNRYTYKSDDYVIDDITRDNVIKAKDGKLHYIDPRVSLNTPEFGGGKRTIGTGKIIATEKTDLQSAKDKLAEAKAKLDSLNKNLGIASDPEQQAKALFAYHKALVNVAKEYIKKFGEDIAAFAKEIGEKVEDIKAAWDEATGGKKLTEGDFAEKVDPIISDAEANILGITKKERQRERAELGEEQYEYEVKHREKLEKEADQLMVDGFSVPNLIKKLQTGRYFPTDAEMELVRRYYISLTAKINKAPTADLLAERKLIQETLDKVGTSMGRGVQAFDGLMAVEDNLASFLGDESVFKELSPEEIADLSEKYNKAKDALEKLQAKTQEALGKERDKIAQKKINELRTQKRAGVKEAFKEERKIIVTSIREKLKALRNSPQLSVFPYARELVVIAPDVRKLVQSHIEEGIYDLKEIVKSIHGMLKDDIEDITENDVRDIVAGEYPNPRKTRNAKMAQIQDLKRQAQLEATIERLEAGIIASKSPVEKKTKSDKILELEKEIALIKKRNPELTAPAKQQSRKTWYANRIKELKGEIAKGDFDPLQPNTPILLDKEALALKDEYAKFVAETRERRQKQEYEAMPLAGKALKKVQEILGVKRLVQTALDLSIPLRQGVSVMLNPRTTGTGVEAYGKMLNQVFSEKNYNRMMHDIRADDSYLESKDDGIVYSEVSSKNPEMRDESHPHESFVYKLPIFGPAFRASERAAAAWTNYARAELYKRGAAMLAAQGKTRENSKQAYEQMAARVMVDTGRGKIPGVSDKAPGKLDNLVKAGLGNTFFGARLYASTFRKLNPFYYFNPKVDKTVRIEALKDMAGYVTSQILLTTAIAAATGAVVSLDWDDPDFLKLRWGKKVIDLTAGQSVYIRTFLRLMNAVYNRVDPDVSKADADKYADFTKKSLETFWRNKLAPNTAYGVNAFMGSNTLGEKFDPYEIIKIYPMYTDDVVTAFKEGRPTDALVTIPVGILGLGYQEYSRDVRRARVANYISPQDKDVQSFLKKHQLNIQGDINQEIYDVNSGDQVKMTKEQSDKYEKIWAESVIAQLKIKQPELERLAEIDKKHVEDENYQEKLTREIGYIKAEATRTAKESVSGVRPEALKIEIDNKSYTLSPDQVKERVAFIKRYTAIKKPHLTPARRKELKDLDSPEEKKALRDKFLQSDAMSASRLKLLKDEAGFKKQATLTD